MKISSLPRQQPTDDETSRKRIGAVSAATVRATATRNKTSSLNQGAECDTSHIIPTVAPAATSFSNSCHEAAIPPAKLSWPHQPSDLQQSACSVHNTTERINLGYIPRWWRSPANWAIAATGPSAASPRNFLWRPPSFQITPPKPSMVFSRKGRDSFTSFAPLHHSPTHHALSGSLQPLFLWKLSANYDAGELPAPLSKNKEICIPIDLQDQRWRPIACMMA